MRKRCRRTVRALVNPITMAMEGAAFTPQDKLDRLRTMELSTIADFRAGRGSLEGLRMLTDMLNLCETLGTMGVGPEALPACAAAHETVLSVMRRFERWQKFEATPAEVTSLEEVYAFLDLQRQSIPRSQLEQAIDQTAKRIRSAHPSCKVYA